LRPATRLFAALNGVNRKGAAMNSTRNFAVEIAAQVVLALAVGLFVSVLLAGATLLLAA
jgi:hypothetical protein